MEFFHEPGFSLRRSSEEDRNQRRPWPHWPCITKNELRNLQTVRRLCRMRSQIVTAFEGKHSAGNRMANASGVRSPD
jgi:hypothetical protein